MARRILIVVNAEWYFVSHRLALARALHAQGYEVVVAAGVERGAERAIVDEGLRFVPIDLRRRSLGIRQEFRTLSALYALYRKERPDLVHHVTLKPIVYGSLAAKAAGVPVVINAITGFGAAFAQPGLRGSLLRRVLTGACWFASTGKRTRVIFQNPEDLAAFVNRGVVRADRAVLIRGAGVDLDRFCPAPEPDGIPIVVLASRLLWEKGIAEFVEASRILRSRNVACRFVLVGVPDEQNPNAVPRCALEAWHLEGIIEWWGLRDDMPEVLRSSAVVALPTTYPEGVPKILLEAAASGRAIVASDVPGCREIVRDGRTGLLIPVRDPAALATAVQKLIEDAGLRGRMGAQGRELAVAEFSEAGTIAATLAVYAELLGQPRTPAVTAAVM